MKNLKIRTKLLGGFILVALIAGTIGILGFISIRNQSNSLTNIKNNRLPALEAFSEINKQRMIIRSQTLEVMLAYNITNMNDFREELKKIQKNRNATWLLVDKYWQVSEDIPRQSEEGKRLQIEIRSQYKAWRDIYIVLDDLIARMITADVNSLPALKEEYNATYEKMVPISNTMGATFELLKENNNKNTNKKVEEDVHASLAAQNFIIIAIIVALALAVLLGFIISGNIQKIILSVTNQTKKLVEAALDGKLSTRAKAEETNEEFRDIVVGINQTLDAVIIPLNVAADYVEKISKGDMPPLITETYKGDFNAIKNNLNSLITAFNDIITKAKMVAQGDLTISLAKRSENDELMGALSEMVSRLSDIVSQVMESAQNVAISSNEMSNSAIQISEGANEQSASAEEVSSSIEEMSSAIQQNSDNSIATERIAVSSAQGMMEFNVSAQKSLEAMRMISEKIKIINDIAGKTDILAINAAIEAARAGEQGKGFAVVAAEVRKLAEVSQKAALEINELSASSLKITEDSGAMMAQIIPEIQKTAQLVKEIAASSNEQRSGAEQITKAVMQFTQVTQQNAAAAEEMSSSSEELASQAELLKETIGFFKTGKQLNIGHPAKSQTIRRTTENTRQRRQTPGFNLNLASLDKEDKMFENF